MGQSLERIGEILVILREEGFGLIGTSLRLRGFIRDKIWLGRFIQFLFDKIIKKNDESLAIRLRRTLERLGPTFIKFGQFLSVRRDFLPAEICQELAKLQNQVKPFPADEARKIVEEELGAKIEEMFLSFQNTPLAAASIAQVHEASLKDGQLVVVKIKRPEADRVMLADLKIMLWLARQIEKVFPLARRIGLTHLCQTFAFTTRNQLDFLKEADNAEIFAKNFREDKDIVIPHVFKEMSSKRIIVMEKASGRSLEPMETLTQEGFQIEKIINIMLRCIAEQFFLYGFFHADIHPGNFLLMPDGRVALLDFGFVGEMKRSLQNTMFRAAYHTVTKRPEEAVEAILEMARISEESDVEGFRQKYIDLLEEFYFQTETHQMSYPELTQKIVTLALGCKLTLPNELVVQGAAFSMIVGLQALVDPSSQITMETLEPIIASVLLKRMKPDKIASEVKTMIPEVIELIEQTPEVLRRLLSLRRSFATKSWPRQLARLEFDLKKKPSFLEKSNESPRWSLWFFSVIFWGPASCFLGWAVFTKQLPLLASFPLIWIYLVGAILLSGILLRKL